jgi:uncharacterized protein (DUF433 family)
MALCERETVNSHELVKPALCRYDQDGGKPAMIDAQLLEHITINPKVMVGKPVIRGTRLTVHYILNRLAHGSSMEDLLSEYQGLAPDDIRACLLFASKSLEDVTFMPLAMQAT